MLRPGHVITLCVAALLCLGVVVVTSAGMTIDPSRQITMSSLLTGRAVLYALLAATAFSLTALLPFDRLLERRRLAGWIIGIGTITCVVLLLLVYVPGVGRAVNGSHRWIQITDSVGFQPSELAKWGLVVILAVYLARQGAEIRRFFSGLMPAILILGLLCGLIILEDLGTAVLMGAAAMVVLLAARARVHHLALFCVLGASVCVAGVVTSEYRMKRVIAFANPYEDPAGVGYHMIQSQAAISAGDVTGQGLGHGLHKFGYLPEDTTDFLFAIICEELGVVGATMVVALYGALLLAGWLVVCREDRLIMRLLGLGVLATIGLQAAMNMMVVTGLAPTKGIALPLLSWGGSGWILCAASLGMIVHMDRRLHKLANQSGTDESASTTFPRADRMVVLP